MVRRPDRSTLDLFRDYEPQPVVPRFVEADVRAWTEARRLSRAIALTLDEDGRGREALADLLSERIGERVSKGMLDNYASPEKPHAISALRLIGLVTITGDARALNLILGEAGLIAIDRKYEALLRRERARELRERLEQEERAADAEWRAKR
ncbi:hypothetical protein [Aquabacter cavernae]|uniref:hypothetical protein n=1 Tax=Aquabacter cavernae TaxID=2496029 RepID=UPI000F8CA417|nr:hypothetical protein [Aquabacter cavernae]